MRDDLLISILRELLSARRLTAAYLAEKYSVSTRTVYRYAKRLSAFLPLSVRRGRAGGVYLADSYLLPSDFFTEDECQTLLDALDAAYEKSADERYLSARRKLTEERRRTSRTPPLPLGGEEIALLTPTGESREKLRVAAGGIRKKRLLLLLYPPLSQKERSVEPYLLLFHENKWYLYAFCRAARAFIPFDMEKITGIFKTEEPFRPRSFTLPPDFTPASHILPKQGV